MLNGKPAVFHNRRKEDGSNDSLCLGCFKTISPFDNGALEGGDQDHVCAFSFPNRRATGQDLDNGLRRRSSDLQWQILISGEDAIGLHG